MKLNEMNDAVHRAAHQGVCQEIQQSAYNAARRACERLATPTAQRIVHWEASYQTVHQITCRIAQTTDRSTYQAADEATCP